MHKVKEKLHRETKVVVDPNIAPTPVAVEGVEPVAVPVPGVLPTPVVMPNLVGGTTTPVYVPVDSLPEGTVLNRAPEHGGNVVVNHGAPTGTGAVSAPTAGTTTPAGTTTAPAGTTTAPAGTTAPVAAPATGQTVTK